MAKLKLKITALMMWHQVILAGSIEKIFDLRKETWFLYKILVLTTSFHEEIRFVASPG
ncbi:MAG: hypothetical protein HC903_20190 [Methylacidiphilales bacterium]|nr:hypothetical protein [Candidatus Methylacidiphilales bacterium]